MMGRLEQQWRHFWSRQTNPAAITLFRIGLGGSFALLLLSCLFTWEYYYAPDGTLSLNDTGIAHYPRDPWSFFTWTDPWLPVRVYWWAGLATCVAFMLGWKTRWAAIFLYLLQHSMIKQNGVATSAGEATFHTFFFYSCFASLDGAWSLDGWLAQRRASATPQPARLHLWPLHLAQLHLAFIYFFSAWYKLITDQGFWRNGEAIYWVTMDMTWAAWPWKDMFNGPVGFRLCQTMTYGFLLLEGTFALLVWLRPTRLLVVALMALFHIVTGLTFPPVLFFSMAMLSALALFLPARTRLPDGWTHGMRCGGK